MLEPMNSKHADKVEAITGADPRITIRRRLTGYAYAANGNTHRPTPRYHWDLLVDGRVMDSSTKRGPLVEAAKTDGATYLAEADETTPIVGTVEKTTDGYWAAFHGNGAHAGDFEARHMAVDHLAYLDSLGEGEAPKAFVDRFRK